MASEPFPLLWLAHWEERWAALRIQGRKKCQVECGILAHGSVRERYADCAHGADAPIDTLMPAFEKPRMNPEFRRGLHGIRESMSEFFRHDAGHREAAMTEAAAEDCPQLPAGELRRRT